ncbi:MAG TPA: methyltransferase domain-containing protein, partial [Gemmatimonadales bacterium]|nr:methyltransferase domain-containing protein [Gemmatimonadales bacterium]
MFHSPTTSAAEGYDTHYREWVERFGPRATDLDWRLTQLEWRQRILLRRYPPEGRRVLDFGCMDGVFTIRVQRMGGEAVGYDISPAAIGQAKRFRGSAARPVFTTVAPGPGQFDLIYCNEALENVEDDSGLVGELTGYLAPGGSVVGTTPLGDLTDQAGQRRLYDESLLTRCLAPWG